MFTCSFSHLIFITEKCILVLYHREYNIMKVIKYERSGRVVEFYGYYNHARLSPEEKANRPIRPKPDSVAVSKSRAFALASRKLYLNPQLQYFVTLTYRNQHQDYKMILDDLKNCFTRNKIQYLAVVERHKSGNFHIHAITSVLPMRQTHYSFSKKKQLFDTPVWHKGFSDVVRISDVTDDNFRIESYIFKYLKKGEKVGHKWVLSSRGLSNFNVSISEISEEIFYHRYRNSLSKLHHRMSFIPDSNNVIMTVYR